jgi:hypothetical protein
VTFWCGSESGSADPRTSSDSDYFFHPVQESKEAVPQECIRYNTTGQTVPANSPPAQAIQVEDPNLKRCHQEMNVFNSYSPPVPFKQKDNLEFFFFFF